MLAFEVGDLSVWVDNSLPAGVRYAYGHDDHGGRTLLISQAVSADEAIRLVKQYAGTGPMTEGRTALVRLLQTA